VLFFGKKNKSQSNAIHPLVARTAFCTVCNSDQMFSKCWRRAAMVRECTGCAALFSNAGELYRGFQPSCPRCGEFLEHPGFDYGICVTCGSKFELPDGAKPSLLPNKEQRQRMGYFAPPKNK
jgi:hypothetical protein